MIEMLLSKIHRATVTDANLNYIGSITIDETLLKEANLRVGQKVDIVNIDNGERFQTYIILGEKDSGEICLNGAAARKVAVGDKIIIMAYYYVQQTQLENEPYNPTVISVDNNNKVIQKTHELSGGLYE